MKTESSVKTWQESNSPTFIRDDAAGAVTVSFTFILSVLSYPRGLTAQLEILGLKLKIKIKETKKEYLEVIKD